MSVDKSQLRSVSKDELQSLRLPFEVRDAFSTVDEAAALLDRVGVMSTWSSIGSLPSLAKAVRRGPEAEKLVWDLQAVLPQTKRAHYAKILEGKGTLISIKLLPHFVAVAGGLSYEDRYKEGRLSSDAVKVAAFLKENGATSADRLRADTDYAGKEAGKAFEKALLELQQQFLIAPVDQVPGNGNFMITVWDLADRWYNTADWQPTTRQDSLNHLVHHLATISGLVSEAELKSWFKPYNINLAQPLEALMTTGAIRVYGKTGTARLFATPETEAKLR